MTESTRIASKFDAVRSLISGALTGYDDGVMVYHDGQTPPSDSAIATEIVKLQAEYDVQEYAIHRQPEYPVLQDQLDMQYHDEVNGTTTWKDAVEAVKTKWPKDNSGPVE
jgi:hypothetical protein